VSICVHLWFQGFQREEAMTITNLPQGFSFAPAGTKIDAPAAAREFEALLIAGLLKTARQAGETLGTASTQAGAEGYVEIAEEHVARVMAQRGAFGISQILLKKLESGVPESGAPGAAPSSVSGAAMPGVSGAAPAADALPAALRQAAPPENSGFPQNRR
jgi:Rod binding domain-containing protein